MNLLFAPFAFVLILILPGYVTSRALFRAADALSVGEKIFLPIATSILISLWFGLLLAELGWFSLVNLCALVAIYSAAVWLVRREHLAEWSLAGMRPDWIFIAILAVGALLAFHPAESILGNTDAGVYVNLGASIAQTGAIAIHDPLVQSLPADPGRQFFWDLINPFMLYKQLRLPGFFIADAGRGLVLPQFLHLYPVWLAIFDAALGFRWGLYGTPIIGLLGSLAAYFVARQLFQPRVARLAFFLLVISVPQFWFARYPVAEAMTQFLMLTGMNALLRTRTPSAESQGWGTGSKAVPHSSHIKSSAGFPLIAGMAFAEIFFTRADAILLLAPIGVYALVLILTRSWRRGHWIFFLTFGAFLAHALAHMWVFSADYIYFQYSHFLRMKNLDKLLPGGQGLPTANDFIRHPESLALLAGLCVFGLFALFMLDRLAQFLRQRFGSHVTGALPRYEQGLRWLGVALVAGLLLFAYFIWPRPTTWYAYVGGETPLDRSANLIKFGWYLSPIGIALALLGATIVVRRDLRRDNAFFYGTAALFSVFYLEELYSNPHYIYTTRHYIPLVLPLFILLAARGLDFLWDQGASSRLPLRFFPRLTAGGALGLWLIYNLYAMGLVEGTRVNGFALRLPFLQQTMPLGPVRLEPLGNALVGEAELAGAFDQIETLARQLDPNAVVIFSNNRDEPALIATPLHFFYNRDTLVARFNQPNGEKVAALIDGWRAQGRSVILAYGTNGGKLALPGYTLEPLGHFALDVPQWAFAYQYMPRAAWRVNLNYALYRAVPGGSPLAAYPFVIDFARDDYPALVSGFMERPTGAATRWMGTVPNPLAARSNPKTLSATLRLPDASHAIADGSGKFAQASAQVAAQEEVPLDLAITVRAPTEGIPFIVKSGKTKFGQVTLTREFVTYHFTLDRTSLQREDDSFLIDLQTSAFTDADGRVLGAELQSLVLSQ